MRVISLWQPWAQLIIDGRKRYETRHWATRYHGPLAIHAAATINPEVREALSAFEYKKENLAFGAVIGIVELESIIPMTDQFIEAQSIYELAAGLWQVGRYAWKMNVVEKFKVPITEKGRQGFWEWQRP
jgi:hypothetical protein